MVEKATRNARNELIDEYLEAVDAEDFEQYREIFAEQVTYQSMGQTVEGIDDMIEWYEEKLILSDMSHDYDARIHDEEASVAHGHFGGELPDGGEMSAHGLDLFEFNEDDTEITRLVVFTDLPPRA